MAFHPDYATNGKFYIYVDARQRRRQCRRRHVAVQHPHSRVHRRAANPNDGQHALHCQSSAFARPQTITSAAGSASARTTATFTSPRATAAAATTPVRRPHRRHGQRPGHHRRNLLRQDAAHRRRWRRFPRAMPLKNYAIPATNPFWIRRDTRRRRDLGLRPAQSRSATASTAPPATSGSATSARRPARKIDFQAGDSDGGENYGWRLREGHDPDANGGVGGAEARRTMSTPSTTTIATTMHFGGNSRHRRLRLSRARSDASGQILLPRLAEFGGTTDDNYWMFDPANPYGTVANIDSLLTPEHGSPQFPSSFGEDAVGNLYIAYIVSGEVYRIVTNAFTPGDFNGDADVDGRRSRRLGTELRHDTGATREPWATPTATATSMAPTSSPGSRTSAGRRFNVGAAGNQPCPSRRALLAGRCAAVAF